MRSWIRPRNSPSDPSTSSAGREMVRGGVLRLLVLAIDRGILVPDNYLCQLAFSLINEHEAEARRALRSAGPPRAGRLESGARDRAEGRGVPPRVLGAWHSSPHGGRHAERALLVPGGGAGLPRESFDSGRNQDLEGKPMTKPLLLLAAALTAAAPAWGEKHVQSTLDSRLVLAFKANPAEVQRSLDQEADGKPAEIPTYRNVIVGIPAHNPQTNEAGPVLVRIFTTAGVPGFYKTGVRAAVEHETASKGAGSDPGIASESWELKDGKGGTLTLQIRYDRSTPVRAKTEGRPRSGVDPTLWRIDRIEQSVDVVKSIPEGIDRMRNLRFRNNVAELDKLFDGKEQLISVISIPWYTRQTFLPD